MECGDATLKKNTDNLSEKHQSIVKNTRKNSMIVYLEKDLEWIFANHNFQI